MSHSFWARQLFHHYYVVRVHQACLFQRFAPLIYDLFNSRKFLGVKTAKFLNARMLHAESLTQRFADSPIAVPKSSTVQFYRRPLPEWCIPFSSEKGKLLFKESLLDGYANVYFRLAEQFHTQDDPAYCGVSTLVMVLNSLEVDPKRVWKGVWRWYHEGMLQCCVPLDVVQQKGITLDQFVCLASCNSLDVVFTRVDDAKDLEEFRKVIRETCRKDNRVLVCSYSRKVVGQTGDGHFSPIGAYHPGLDLVLILDVARFKYPPHWISVDLLWKSMQALDNTTGLPRGYVLLQKTEETPLLLFRMSTTFRATIGTGSLMGSAMARFLQEWQAFLGSVVRDDSRCESFESAAEIVLSALNEVLSALLVTDSIFTTQVNMCCLSNLSAEHRASIGVLVASLEHAGIYRVVDGWVKVCEANNEEVISPGLGTCCRLGRVGVSAGDVDMDAVASQQNLSSGCDSSGTTLPTCFGHAEDASAAVQIGVSHYLNLLLLCWPYDQRTVGTYASCLHAHVESSFCELGSLLQNEIRQLRLQISSLLGMVQK